MKVSRSTAVALCSVPLVSAALTVATRYTWDNWHGVPFLDCPRQLDLGERKRGDIAIGNFKIRNAGNDDLHLDEFQTSCSCAGVEQEIDGKRYRIQSLSLPPGQEVQLSVRLGVGVRPGESQHVQVVFNTNDPKNPHWLLEVLVPRVTGGCFSDPRAVVFGPLSPGQRNTRIIDLFENGAPGRMVEKVYSSHPERFSAELVPLSEKDRQCVHSTAGRLFAHIQVTPHTERPGRLDGDLLVSVANETNVERIPVIGEVVGIAECRPSSLVLPRRVQNRIVHSGEVLILNRLEKPIEVAIDFLPPDIVADVRPVPDHPDQRLLQIAWRRAENANRKVGSEERARLRIRCDGQESNLEVPIVLAED
jgi:hypothetical protein